MTGLFNLVSAHHLISFQPMYKSKEIRWFSDQPDRSISEWFTQYGLNFENIESRTDFYLPLEKDDVNIKLREGNIEVKHRISSPVLGKLSPNVKGLYEEWIKWSFGVNQIDPVAQEIISLNKYRWIATLKRRMGIKLKDLDGNRSPEIVPITEIIDCGCQVEYTKIGINKKTYYTFALEWFGDPYPVLSESFLENITEKIVLKSEDSMGYAQFLKKIQLSE